MEFKKYNKLIYADKEVITKIIDAGIDISDWVALEKIHGANYAFFIKDGIYKPACRSKFLDNPGEFYSSNRAIENSINAIINVMAMFPNKEVRLVGELFGGNYPHPDVEKVRQATRVQKGVYYHPDNMFYLFDIHMDGNWLPHDEVVDIGTKAGFVTAVPLQRGSLLDLVNMDIEFETTLPEALGLPKIDDNIAEGVVLKPNVPIYFKSGKRVILKLKNDKFREKQAKRKSRKPAPTIEMLDQEVREIYNKLSTYITEQRLDNILSHGKKFNNFGEVQGAFVQDMLEEAEQDEGLTINNLSKKERKVIMKHIMKEAADVIRPRISEVLNGPEIT